MKKSLFYTASIFFQALIAFGFCQYAFADRGEYNRGITDLQNRTFPIKIDGQISCQNKKTGELTRNVAEADTCSLKVHDSKTDRDYKIKGSTDLTEDAMTLYTAGIAHVSVVGTLTDSETVTMQQITKY